LSSPKKYNSPKHKKPAGNAPVIEKKQEHQKTGDKRSRRRSYDQSIFPGKWQINAGLFLLFVFGTIALYAGDLHLGFFRVDDQQYVVRNPWIKGISSENIGYILSHPYFVNYSPVHLFSYMLDYAIGGLNAFAFHLSSNIWAGIVAGFVYLVTIALMKQRWIAVAAALLFVLHPVHVEAVVWISSRKDLVAVAFLLPSVLAYLKYRKTDGSRKWYVLSVFLFLLALAGKLSVATFPAVLLALDLFVEKRPLMRSLIDKIPYLIAGFIIAVAVANAQPKTGVHFDVSVLANAFAQSMWLLTGFGNYVLYHEPPGQGTILFQLGGALLLVAIFLLPLLLRKRYPLAVVLIYWILFTYLPTQVLSFTYPVTDRYLFLPSVAAAMLFAWLVFETTQRLKKGQLIAASIVIFVVGVFWFQRTINYINEWRDPRSVWFAARNKSRDVQVYYNLGWNYLDKAAAFGTKRRKAVLPEDEAKKYASLVWENDPRLPQLLTELSTNQHNGPVENAFKDDLLNKAKQYFDSAVAVKGNHIMGELYFHRGMLFIDKADMPAAKKEFLAAINEASRLSFTEGQEEVFVNCHYNLGIAEWTMGNYTEALKWIKLAEEEQNKFGGNWFPDLATNRKRLEGIIATLQSK
jgi:hypothetical protein